MSSSSAPTSTTTTHSATMVGTTTNAATAAAKQAQAAKMHRRSRSGCFTCRLRRKKCDEGKPSCRACKHLGLKCEYKRPMWWSNNEQRRNQKEAIKNIIKRTKLNEKTAQSGAMGTSTPPSLCHSMQTADTFSDGVGCTRAPSVDSQNSLDYQFNPAATTTIDLYNSTMPPPNFPPNFAHPGHYVPYDVDIKTESHMFINDIPTRRDSTISSYTHYQTPPVFPTDNWIQQDYFERRGSFTEEPLDFPIFDYNTYGTFSPSHQPSIHVDDCDRHLLSHFLENIMPSAFPVLETNQPGAAQRDVIIPALETNKAYLHCCMSISALHMKTTQGLTGEQIDQDIQRHRGETVQQLTASLYSDSHHSQTLEAALGMIFFQCSVGRFNDGLMDIPWHGHFEAVQNLVHRLDLPAQMIAMNGQAHAQPPFNMTLASWIDILGATMLGRTPSFADTYREKLIADASSGLAELMGCEDRIMYLISEIACLEALKKENMDIVQLCAHIKLLGEQISLTEPPQGSLNSAYTSTGEILPRQLRRNMTAVYRLAARIYLCSLVPDFDRTSHTFVNLVSALCKAMAYIPAGPDGFDRSLIWPLLVAGSISVPQSAFRNMFADRSALLGEAANFGSYGRVKNLLDQVWLVNDANLAEGNTQYVHWRDMMRQKNWDFLLI